MKYILRFALVVSLFALTITACVDEVLLSTTPTMPTKSAIADKYVVADTTITLTVRGSTINNDVSINYSYYLSDDDGNNFVCIGKSVQSATVNLKPYTQYKWYAVAVLDSHESEPTEVRTFYCVPPFALQTDNGDGG